MTSTNISPSVSLDVLLPILGIPSQLAKQLLHYIEMNPVALEHGSVDLREQMKDLKDSPKPFFLHMIELFGPELSGPKPWIGWRSNTFAIQSADGLYFQVIYVDVVAANSSERAKYHFEQIMERLERYNLLDFMVAFVSDNCPNNIFAMDRWTVPHLWDITRMLNWFPEVHGVCNRTLERAYKVRFERSSFQNVFTTIRRRLDDEVSIMNPCSTRPDDVLLESMRHLRSMEAAVKRFFAHSGVDIFEPNYMSNKTLELIGKKWKKKLETLMKPTGPFDVVTLIEEGWEIFPKSFALLAYIEGYRDTEFRNFENPSVKNVT